MIWGDKSEKRIVFQTGSFVTFVSMGVEFALQTAQNFFNFKKGMVIKMDKEKDLPKRKPTRLKNFDYSTTGAYFITLCTEDRRKILSQIVVRCFV